MKIAYCVSVLLLVATASAADPCRPPTFPGQAQAKAPPPEPPRYVAGQQGPSGGNGGLYCDTNDIHPFWRLAAMNVNSGNTIDAIDMTFEIPTSPGNPPQKKTVHCGGTGGTPNEPLTLAPGEYIVRIIGHYGNSVDSLFVQTTKQMRNYGNKNSTAPGTFDYIAPEGYAIAGLVLQTCTYVDALGVVLRRP